MIVSTAQKFFDVAFLMNDSVKFFSGNPYGKLLNSARTKESAGSRPPPIIGHLRLTVIPKSSVLSALAVHLLFSPDEVLPSLRVYALDAGLKRVPIRAGAQSKPRHHKIRHMPRCEAVVLGGEVVHQWTAMVVHPTRPRTNNPRQTPEIPPIMMWQMLFISSLCSGK